MNAAHNIESSLGIEGASQGENWYSLVEKTQTAGIVELRAVFLGKYGERPREGGVEVDWLKKNSEYSQYFLP